MCSIWLSVKAKERREKVKVLAVSLDLPSATRGLQTCQHTGLGIHQPRLEEHFSPYYFGDFRGTFGSCSTNYFVVDLL